MNKVSLGDFFFNGGNFHTCETQAFSTMSRRRCSVGQEPVPLLIRVIVMRTTNRNYDRPHEVTQPGQNVKYVVPYHFISGHPRKACYDGMV